MLREIDSYHKRLEELKFHSSNEQSIRGAFSNLLTAYAMEKDLILVEELKFDKHNIPDGTIKDKFRFDFGYWEAKDSKDNLDEEIAKKLKKGYPADNIIFEDSIRAVLIQNKETVFDIEMSNTQKLNELLETFFRYEKPEILEFHKALEQFKEDIPNIIKPIKLKIEVAYKENKEFQKIYNEFLEICKHSIDKNISKEDIFGMLLQHILTEDIFKVIFDDIDFHLHNNISKTLNKLEASFINRYEKKTLFSSIRYYYEAIKSHSLALQDYKEKQKFLNVLYENFYKAYNPKRADKLGIVYTPLEIVDFMIEAVDFLSYKHFNKTLSSKGVKILDPATGTGTFLTQIIDYINPNELKHKYQNELFANEISILPYYIANLNLEYIYQQKTKEYKEFENISFVDTLELNKSTKGQNDLFSFSDENIERIERQEASDINIIIGNPPYNANQQNENDNNKNREYPQIDKRIKDTYVQKSNAQKTKVYDMYSRFYRWSSDRLKQDGIIAFVTNSSFIDSKTFDGFRETIFNEFNEIYIIDLGGNIRKNPKLSGTKNSVFNIQTGVAILLLVKKEVLGKCKLHYVNPFDELEIKEEKLKFLKQNKFNSLNFNLIIPDNKNNWLNQTNNDWDELIPLGTKECKLNRKENAIFKLYSLGVLTARDEWVYDFNKINLKNKVNYFIGEYNDFIELWKKTNKKEDIHSFIYSQNPTIKFTLFLENYVKREYQINFKEDRIYNSLYRPFIKKFTYFSEVISHSMYRQNQIFPNSKSENRVIGVMGQSTEKPFSVLSNKILTDLNSISPASGGNVSFPIFTYTKENEKQENITNYALELFQNHHKNKNIIKEDIFNYTYAILHSNNYREKYKTNLKQELPRIPLQKEFKEFKRLLEIGKELLNLHLNFETVEPYNLKEITKKTNKPNKPKLKLKDDEIQIDEETTLLNLPTKALKYKLGNRSAIEWVLDGYKEKKIKDQTINQKFNNYKFKDHKKELITLIKQITTLSIKTLTLTEKIDKE